MIRLATFLIPLSLLALPQLALPQAPAAHVTSVAVANSEATLPLTVLRGVIVKIDANRQVFVLHTKSGHKVRIKVTQKTHIRVDGQAASFDDLAQGMKARVRAKKVPGHQLFVALGVRAKS